MKGGLAIMLEKYRREIKYIISVKDFYRLKGNLECYIEPDKYSGNTGYPVRSLYFDSHQDRDLFDVLDGLMEKRKIRLRIYSVDSSSVKLEYKCKFNGEGRKMSLIISKKEALRMADGDYSFLLLKKVPLAIKLYSRLKTGGYRPKIIVDYNRIAYVYNPNDVRITFDNNIKASLITSSFFSQNVSWVPIMKPDMGVLEVKYNGFLFGHLKRTIESIDSLATSNSKYANSRIICDF